MSVDEETKRKLLSSVVATTDVAARLRELADQASAERRDAVQAAVNAGIPRQEIAHALGTHRNAIYQILKR